MIIVKKVKLFTFKPFLKNLCKKVTEKKVSEKKPGNKVPGNKITGSKEMKKIYPKRKSPKSWGNDVKSKMFLYKKRTFPLCIYTCWIKQGVFSISSLIFPCMVVNFFCSHEFSTIRELFSGDFFVFNHKKNPWK